VGFRVLEVELPGKAGEGVIFRKQELLEFSICNVPANPYALAARSAAEQCTEYSVQSTVKDVRRGPLAKGEGAAEPPVYNVQCTEYSEKILGDGLYEGERAVRGDGGGAASEQWEDFRRKSVAKDDEAGLGDEANRRESLVKGDEAGQGDEAAIGNEKNGTDDFFGGFFNFGIH
jgi:hypothetical protein